MTTDQASVAGNWNRLEAIQDYLAQLSGILKNMDLQGIQAFVELLASAFSDGRRVFFAGNGGSAATASHFACDMGKTITGYYKGRRLKAIALTDNVPLLTAWGNDADYADVFAEQLRNLASSGDVVVAISCSGNSANVVRAVEVAKQLGLTTVGLSGFGGGKLHHLVDLSIVIDSDNYQYVEDAHAIIMHIATARLAALVEDGADD